MTYPWLHGIILALGGQPIPGEVAQEGITANFDAILQQMIEKRHEKVALKDVKPISLDSLMILVYHKLDYKATTLIELPDDQDPRFSIKKLNTQNWLGAMLPDLVSFDKTGALKSV